MTETSASGLQRRHIVVVGNIGVGKTTLVSNLQKLWPDARALFEIRESGLEAFYRNPEQNAFQIQLAYTIQFLEQAARIGRSPGVVVQDRSILDTHEVFTEARRGGGLISEEEHSLLERLFAIAVNLAPPTHLVLLEADEQTCLTRVRNRGIPAEMGVSIPLLKALNVAYGRWFDRFDICPKRRISTEERSSASVAAEVARFVSWPPSPAAPASSDG